MPSTLELDSSYTFQMPEEMGSARFSFDVPTGGLVKMEASAAEQNAIPVEVAIGPSGQEVQRIQLGTGGQAAYTVTFG